MPPALHLFDGEAHSSLRPLTWLRPVGELRCGILTTAERWRERLRRATTVGYLTQAHLLGGYPTALAEDNLVVHAAALLPGAAGWLDGLELDDVLTHNGRFLAGRLRPDAVAELVAGRDVSEIAGLSVRTYGGQIDWLLRPHDLFTNNAAQILRDVELLTAGRTSASLSSTTTVLGEHSVFAEEGVICEAAVLDAREGPIYLAAGAEVMPGALLRGPLAVGEGAAIKLGAKIYGGTTVGPHCKVGGEVQNVVFQGYANKGHDGYLGNAVIGRWCNLGADTNASNLKNTYGGVRAWSYEEERFVDTGLQFCGLVMGDHAKCGINTMFNTGTVVGTAANVFGAGFPRAFVPDFAWGGASGFSTYRLDRACETAERVLARRGFDLTDARRAALQHVFAATAPHRRWE